MIRIGLVDLDTSHPQAFTRILHTIPGVEVTALWDGHDVWPPGYDAKFAREQNVPVVCARLEEMPDHVDAAMIHGTNWDTHVEKALVFMKAKKPVLIDKPVVGSIRECERLADLQEKHGTLVYGGSSLRYAKEVTTLREMVGASEQLISVEATGPGDFFSYGIHTTEMLQGFAGIGIRSVKCVTEKRVPVFAATYHNGLVALIHLQMPHHEWSLCAYTDHGMRTAIVNPNALYEPFLRNFVALLKGDTVEYTLEGPIEAVRVHIAAKISRRTNKEIVLDTLPPEEGFDGGAFAAEYALTKRQQESSARQ